MAGYNNVYVPRVDETPVPCPDGYKSTDCIYLSDEVQAGEFGLMPRADLTAMLNAMTCRIKEQDKIITGLKNKIKELENGATWE